MSCVPDAKKYKSAGCEGGNMYGFSGNAARWGLTKEKDNKYKCGAGDPKKHFQQKSNCKKYPWNGQCSGSPQPDWWWGGFDKVTGESNMIAQLVDGKSMYVSMKVYSNFFGLRGDNIYDAVSGSVKGGHAMNCMGYGVKSGTKYWILQNSWGAGSWGNKGYGRIIRGKDIA